MKRFPFVIGSTIAGLAGVLGFHSQNTMHALTNALPITSRGPQGAARSAGYPVNRVNPASTVPAGSPQVSPTTSAVGNREQYGYGILSVRVTVSGSKVVSLQVADLQTADSYSQQIANQVIPYLRREVRRMLRDMAAAYKPSKAQMEAAGSPEDVHALVAEAYKRFLAEEDAALRGEPGELPLKPEDEEVPVPGRIIVACPKCGQKVGTQELREHMAAAHGEGA